MNSRRYAMTSLSIVLLAVTIMSVSVLGNSAYSDHVVGSGGTIDVVAAEGSNTISINGTTDRSGEVIIKVTAPNRNLVSIDQITPTGEDIRLEYSTTITTGGPLWSQDGDYTVTVQQSHGGCPATDINPNHNTKVNVYNCGQQFMENKYFPKGESDKGPWGDRVYFDKILKEHWDPYAEKFDTLMRSRKAHGGIANHFRNK